MNAPAVVALDLGGVIVDIDHGRCLTRLGVPRDNRALLERAFFDGGLHDDVTVGRVDGAAFAAEAARRVGLPADAVSAAWALVCDVMPAGRALVAELIERGHRVHLWSNTDPIHLAHMTAQLPAGVVVDTASFRVGSMKPLPEYFAKAAALGVPALFLDDRADNVAAAVAAGIVARRCDGPAEARAHLADVGLL